MFVTKQLKSSNFGLNIATSEKLFHQRWGYDIANHGNKYGNCKIKIHLNTKDLGSKYS